MLILFTFLIFSIIEKEKRAIVISLLSVLFLILIALGFQFIPKSLQNIVTILGAVFCLLLFFPFGNRKVHLINLYNRHDERDVMFSRNELKVNSERYNSYYSENPELKLKDEIFRAQPGLLNESSHFYNPLLFNASEASFTAVELLNPLVENKKTKNSEKKVSQSEISIFIKNWAKILGAHSVGFTELMPHHIYTHIGRGEEYGNEVCLNHKYAIAFTVEMNYELVKSAPKGTIVMESAHQYFNSGQIAIQVAQFIRQMGYEARAHIDANYRVICPLVAQDAGLGTIGRMGLLITPKLGPRVRIGVVTTDLKLPLVNKKNNIDTSVLRFCELCKKCAVNCPSQSISFDKANKNGKWGNWKINHEDCFIYWTKAGTDCGRCVSVCPYSHPNNIIHNLIRWLIRRNSLNRWIALKLDDLFYTKKPNVQPLKSWMKT